MPIYGVVLMIAIASAMLWASRRAPAWMANSQNAGRVLARTSPPRPDSRRARGLVWSQRFAQYFLLLAGLAIYIGTVVVVLVDGVSG